MVSMIQKLKKIDKMDMVFSVLFFSWFIYLFSPFHYDEGVISADGVTYAHIAKNILLDGTLGWQATWAPPFFSILIAGVYPFFSNLFVSGYIVTVVMLYLLPFSIYLLAGDMFGKKVGLLAAVLTGLHPHFLSIPGVNEPEVTYTTLLVFSVAFSWLAYSRTSLIYGILSGLFFSMAYLTRSEGIVIFLFILCAVTYLNIRDKKGIKLPAYVIVMIFAFTLTSAPYLVFLKGTYGKWVLSSKSSYVQIWMKWRIYHDNDFGEQGNPELWGLSKNGKLMWQEPKGVGDLITYLLSHPGKSLRVYMYNFSLQIPGKVPNSSGQERFPSVFPIYFFILALCAFAFHNKEILKRLLFLSSPFLILFVLPVFAEGWVKYLLPYLPFLIILASVGLTALAGKISGDNMRNLLIAFVVLFIISYDLWAIRPPAVTPSAAYRGSMAVEQKKAGEWAQKRFAGTPNYMIQWSKLAYYLNGRWTAMPVTSYEGMIWYARKNRADYLVFETGGRGESEEFMREMGNIPDLEVAGVYESQTTGYGVVFFRLKK